MLNIYGFNFIDQNHYRRFSRMFNTRGLKKWDSEYCAAFYILSSDQSIFNKTIKCIYTDGIDTQKLRKMKCLSSSERYLINIACALFNSIQDLKLDFYWLIKLDCTQYYVVLEAFQIRRS